MKYEHTKESWELELKLFAMFGACDLTIDLMETLAAKRPVTRYGFYSIRKRRTMEFVR